MASAVNCSSLTQSLDTSVICHAAFIFCLVSFLLEGIYMKTLCFDSSKNQLLLTWAALFNLELFASTVYCVACKKCLFSSSVSLDITVALLRESFTFF